MSKLSVGYFVWSWVTRRGNKFEHFGNKLMTILKSKQTDVQGGVSTNCFIMLSIAIENASVQGQGGKFHPPWDRGGENPN